MSTTWTQAEFEALKKAVASGVLTVIYDGPPRRQVTYQSLTEMRSLLSEMRQETARASGRSSTRLVATRKGF